MLKPLSLITIILLFVGGGMYFFHEDSFITKSQKSSLSGQKLLEKLDTKTLDQIKIFGLGSEINLVQLQGGGWQEKISNYEADIAPIQDFLINLSQISLGNMVTDNPEHHERFQLLNPPDNIEEWEEGRHGFSVNLLRGDGTSVLSLLLGKERSNGQGQYIRQAGSNKIYLIPERLSVYSEVDDWLRKDLLALESNQIKSLELQSGDNISVSLSRGDAETAWVSVPEKSNFNDSEKINKVLDRLGDLTFSKLLKKYVLSQELTDSPAKEESLSIALFDGRVYSLNFSKKESLDENYLLSLRMGIAVEASESADAEDSDLRKEMDAFNQRVNGRLFEISSWEAKELLFSDQ
ncbi:MAG: hypothetical protein MAG581_00211 [Deltaproteobacteria bacterium]|jgi:hypothetical protein|nr:hypothetical protein [Deltaproteobacteria bacterium]